MLRKREVSKQVESCEISDSFLAQTTSTENCSESVEGSLKDCCDSGIPRRDYCFSSNQVSEGEFVRKNGNCREIANGATCHTSTLGRSKHISSIPGDRAKKKARKYQHGQLSLRSFFQKSPNVSCDVNNSTTDTSLNQEDVPEFHHHSNKSPVTEYYSCDCEPHELNSSVCSRDQVEQDGNCSLDKEKNNIALLEWRRIQQLMENSIPFCKGHKEPCVARVVKKPGPTFGRRFYVCARAEGPASNPEANCGYFKWASSKSKQK